MGGLAADTCDYSCVYVELVAAHAPLTQYSAVATSHNYMLFFKECLIPISSVQPLEHLNQLD